MSDLFEYAPIEDIDREFVDYVGVHPLSWYDCKEPTAAFVESKYTTEMFDELLAACMAAKESLLSICERHPAQCCTLVIEILQEAIAKAKGEER